jgi:hypothetical protein
MSGLLNYYGTRRPVTGSFSVRLEVASNCSGCVYSSGIAANQDFHAAWDACGSPNAIKAAHPLHRFSGGQVSIGGTPVEVFLVVFGAVLIPAASDEAGIFQSGSERGVFVCWSVDIVGGGQSQRSILLPPDPSFNNSTQPIWCFSSPGAERFDGTCWRDFGSAGGAGTWSDRLISTGCDSPMGTYSRRNPTGQIGMSWTAVIS